LNPSLDGRRTCVRVNESRPGGEFERAHIECVGVAMLADLRVHPPGVSRPNFWSSSSINFCHLPTMASHQVLRSSSGSFATLAAIRRASSRVSKSSAAVRWGRRSYRQRLPLSSQTRFSFFNGRYGPPAALPITAPFFFESETAGLMFVRHPWPQSFPWWLFGRFPREDAAADYECGQD
jgi:hypothetical protein